MKRLVLVMAAIAFLCLGFGAPTQAATWDLFYEAVLSPTGPTGNTVIRLSSPYPGGTTPYGYIRYKPDAPFALSGLNVLSADFNMVQGPFVWGAPRFDIGLDFNNDGLFDYTNDRLIWGYWGTPPWGSGAPPTGWINTGNFMDTSLWGDIKFWDGGTQYTAAGLKAAFGGLNVMRAYVSLDGGGAGNTQILDVDNFRVNNDVFSPASVPEPGTLLLLGSGLLGLVVAGRRKFRK